MTKEKCALAGYGTRLCFECLSVGEGEEEDGRGRNSNWPWVVSYGLIHHQVPCYNVSRGTWHECRAHTTHIRTIQ